MLKIKDVSVGDFLVMKGLKPEEQGYFAVKVKSISERRLHTTSFYIDDTNLHHYEFYCRIPKYIRDWEKKLDD